MSIKSLPFFRNDLFENKPEAEYHRNIHNRLKSGELMRLRCIKPLSTGILVDLSASGGLKNVDVTHQIRFVLTIMAKRREKKGDKLL